MLNFDNCPELPALVNGTFSIVVWPGVVTDVSESVSVAVPEIADVDDDDTWWLVPDPICVVSLVVEA